MYEILSCAKNTQLHSFPSLDVLGVGTHANDGKDSNESVCQFFPRTKLFLRTNRNWGVELLRIKDINGMRKFPLNSPIIVLLFNNRWDFSFWKQQQWHTYRNVQ